MKERCSVHRNPFCAPQSFHKLLNRGRQSLSWLSCLTLWYCHSCKSCQVTRCCSILSPAPNTNLQSNGWGAKGMQKNPPDVPPRVYKTLGSLKLLKLPIGGNTPGKCLNSLNVLPTNANSASESHLVDFYKADQLPVRKREIRPEFQRWVRWVKKPKQPGLLLFRNFRPLNNTNNQNETYFVLFYFGNQCFHSD